MVGRQHRKAFLKENQAGTRDEVGPLESGRKSMEEGHESDMLYERLVQQIP